MSKNHPHDNIYSILGKLDALKPTPEEKRFALVKEIQESVEAQGSILEGVDAVEARLAQQFAAEGEITRTAGKTVHRSTNAYGGTPKEKDPLATLDKAGTNRIEKAMGVKFDHGQHNVVQVDEKAPPGMEDEVLKLKKQYPGEPAKAFATAWTIYNKKHGKTEESREACAECSMHEGETTHKGGEKVATKTGTIHKSKATVDTEKELSRGDVPDLDKDDDAPASTEKKGRGRPKMATKDRSQASLPWGGKPPKDTYKHQKGSFVHKISESRLIDESGETLDHILNRFKHDVKRFEAGEDIYNSDLYHALFDYYSENGEMPYGTQKARDGDPVEFIHDRLDMALADKAYGKDPANAEGYGLEQEAIGEPQPGIPGNVPLDDKMSRLNKPRDYYEEEVTMEDELNELARLAGLNTNEGNAFSGKLAHTAKGDSFEQDGKTFTNRSSIADKELDEEETDEGNVFGQAVRNAKADGVQPGEKVEVDGKEIPVKESTSFDGGNESQFNISTNMNNEGDKSVTVTATGEHAASLLQMLRIAGLGGGEKAKELEQHPSIEIIGSDEGCEVDEVASQQDLADIEAQDREHEIGNDYDEVDEAGVAVDQPATEPVNGPKPEYKTMRASTMGPGEGDAGEKEMNPDRPTFKNGDNALSNPPTRGKEVLKAVAALESKLAAEYESIKKISK